MKLFIKNTLSTEISVSFFKSKINIKFVIRSNKLTIQLRKNLDKKLSGLAWQAYAELGF